MKTGSMSPATPPPRESPAPSYTDEGPSTLAELKRESVRLETFSKWPIDFISAAQLAQSGFVYTGRRDCVRCVFCGEYVGEWDRGDDPLTEHRALFPHCPFMQGQDVGNVALPTTAQQQQQQQTQTNNNEQQQEDMEQELTNNDTHRSPSRASSAASTASLHEDDHMSVSRTRSSPTDEVGNHSRGADETGPRPNVGLTGMPDSQKASVLHWNNSVSGKDCDGIGIFRHSGPAQTKYSTIEARIRTFSEWPPALRQQPKQLAEAGFYYIGLSDQVKCFYCDGGLRNWQPEDDPWTEHARWFSKCGFVRLVKGDEFIKSCVSQRPPENMPGCEETLPQSSELTDSDLHQLMCSNAMVQQALQMGVDSSRLKMAIKRRHREKGVFFNSLNQLMDASFAEHIEQEARHDVEGGGPSTSSAAEARFDSGAGARSEDECGIRPISRSDTETRENQIETERSEDMSEEEEPVPSSSSSALKHSTSEPMPNNAAENLDVAKKSFSVHESLGIQAEGFDLEKENRRLKEQRTCKICMDNEIGVVFLPCGHLICCVQCALALKDCPLCRQPIHGTVKTYMS